jgi:uncharacterized membrane protein YcaP (DUF421 family)
MSLKRFQYRVIETADVVELEGQLRDAGTKQWSAVGYGVLPDGRRSVLMERKVKVHDRHRHHREVHPSPEDN